MVSHNHRDTLAEDVRKQGAEKDIWAEERRRNRGVEKTTQRGALRSVFLTKYSGDQIKNSEMGGACGTYVNRRGSYKILVGRTDGKTPIGRSWYG